MRDAAAARAPRARRRRRPLVRSRAAAGRRARATQSDRGRWGRRRPAAAPWRWRETVARFPQKPARKESLSCFREEVVERAHEFGGRLDVRAVPHRQLLQTSLQQRGELARTGDRERIERPVQNQRRGKEEAGRGLPDFGTKVIITEAVPNGLLGPSVDAEGREVLRVMVIAEVAGYGQLECSPSIGCGIALAQAAGAQRVALAFDLGRRHATREFLLELASVLGGRRAGSNERQAFDAFRVLDEVQYRQQTAPGITAQRQ